MPQLVTNSISINSTFAVDLSPCARDAHTFLSLPPLRALFVCALMLGSSAFEWFGRRAPGPADHCEVNRTEWSLRRKLFTSATRAGAATHPTHNQHEPDRDSERIDLYHLSMPMDENKNRNNRFVSLANVCSPRHQVDFDRGLCFHLPSLLFSPAALASSISDSFKIKTLFILCVVGSFRVSIPFFISFFVFRECVCQLFRFLLAILFRPLDGKLTCIRPGLRPLSPFNKYRTTALFSNLR